MSRITLTQCVWENDEQILREIKDGLMTSRPQKSRVFKGSLFISITIRPICPRLARPQLCVCVCFNCHECVWLWSAFMSLWVCVSLHDPSALKALVSSVDTTEMFSRMSSLHREQTRLVLSCWLRYDGLILPQRELNTLKFSHARRTQEKPPLSSRVDKYNINERIAKPGRTLAEIGSKCMQRRLWPSVAPFSLEVMLLRSCAHP